MITIRKTKEKIPSSYKTLYITNELIDKINEIAKQYDTSFNNVVVSMIKSCIDE